MYGARVEVQVFRKGLHTHIQLDYVIIEFLSCKKKKKKKPIFQVNTNPIPLG